MSIPRTELRLTVAEGIVTLEGQVERRSQISMIVERIRRIDGTVGVITRLGWIEDDTVVELGPLPLSRVGW